MMSTGGTDPSQAPTGDLATALDHARRLLGADPRLAEAQAREILAVIPSEPSALVLLAEALARSGQAAAAIEALRQAVSVAPEHALAWRTLGDHLALAGDAAGADAAYMRHVGASVHDPALIEAGAALYGGHLAQAEARLRAYLRAHPTDPAAIRMLAELAIRLGRYADAERLLNRCLELAPSFDVARHQLAVALHRQNRGVEALRQLEPLMAKDQRNPTHLNLKAAILVRLGDYQEAAALYAGVLADFPQQPKGWMSYGHALKTLGRLDESIQAYRTAIRQAPSLGEAYWSLANLKTVRFDDADVRAIEEQLGRDDLSDEDRYHLDFSLGKALEDRGDYAASFVAYDRGNARRRQELDYSADENRAFVARAEAVQTKAFFAERAGWGDPAADPIFIVGMPRAGSTLLEQILASHSQVEGTMELPDVIAIAQRLGEARRRGEVSKYPEVLAELGAADAAALGAEYLDRSRVQRKLGRPFFIDKMPNNFAHVGLIHLMLPNAKIIDARRHPLGCCFSGFKQHFARGQGFSYSLDDIGGYYADYVRLMAHFDAALPGRMHRVFYEQLIADPEGEIRRLLDYCGLAFEAGCLQFHRNDRAVRTPSAEQVRRPLFSDAVDHWRRYEPWLGPLKAALGEALTTYPHTGAV